MPWQLYTYKPWSLTHSLTATLEKSLNVERKNFKLFLFKLEEKQVEKVETEKVRNTTFAFLYCRQNQRNMSVAFLFLATLAALYLTLVSD